MNEEHTPEPWRIEVEEDHTGKRDALSIIGADGEVVACDQTYYPTFEAKNASRINACVNACAEIPTSILETLTPGTSWGDRYMQALREQNRELLKALERVQESPNSAWLIADEALRAATSGSSSPLPQ